MNWEVVRQALSMIALAASPTLGAQLSKKFINARETAIDFYSLFGFKQVGEIFYKNGGAYFKMQMHF